MVGDSSELHSKQALKFVFQHLKAAASNLDKPKARTTRLQSDVGQGASAVHQWLGDLPVSTPELSRSWMLSSGCYCLSSNPSLPVEVQTQLEASWPQHNSLLAGSCRGAKGREGKERGREGGCVGRSRGSTGAGSSCPAPVRAQAKSSKFSVL